MNTSADRAAVLLGLDSVAAVYVFDTPSEDFLDLAEPDIWVKGGDYSVDKLKPAERAVLERISGEIVILPLHTGDSTSTIVKRIKLSGRSVTIPIEREPNYVEPSEPWPRHSIHGGPDCDCHKPVTVEAPPMREATDEDRERLGVPIVVPTRERLQRERVTGASTADESSRLAFEQWISAPPYEREVKRWPMDETKHAWPNQYEDIGVQLAWEAWQEAKRT